MSYLQFAYPKKGNLSALDGPPGPPFIQPTPKGGLHYYTWRNATARDALKEKEDGAAAAENNPEPIPGRVSRRYQDQNFIQCMQPLQLFRPQTLTGRSSVKGENRSESGLKEIVQSAYGNGKVKLKVKAVGTGHSFSDVMTTPDFLVVTDDLNEMLTDPSQGQFDQLNIRHYPLLRQEVKDCYEEFADMADVDEDHRPGLVEFEAGIKLFDLTDKLWERGWSVYNLGTYQGQSFIGAVSTSTHGSGLSLGPLPDMIKSLVLVADEGLTYRIEPTKGITASKGLRRAAPDHFPKDFMQLPQGKRAIFRSRRDPGVDYLIQDDDFFNAALVNVGTFGIVYSVIVQVTPRFCLIEAAEITTWEKLKIRLADPGAYADIFDTKEFISGLKYKTPTPDSEFCQDNFLKVSKIRHTSMLFNANYYDRSGENIIFFRITRQYEVPWKLVEENEWLDPKDKGRLLDPTLKKMMQPLFDIMGERLARGEAAQKRLYEIKVKLICGTIVFEGTAKNKITEDIARFSPYLGWLKDTVQEDPVESLIDSLLGDKTLNGIANGLFQVDEKAKAAKEGNGLQPKQSEFYLNRNYRVHVKSSDLNGYGIETGFRFEKRENQTIPDYITAIERAIIIAEEHWMEGRYIQTASTAVRFVKASPAYLSPQYGETTCMIEMLNVADTHGGKELFYRYQTEYAKMGGRPHWGLDLSVTTGNNGFLERTYPMFPMWKKIYDLFNVHGTFDNRFTDRMGLSVQPYERKV
ncbi:MAG TPA: D-arabinono-1,4-lactone oxidase [Bacteroidia bacterium]|nr:D-arabinono-1,4-lactone oxidase [Bacteroidia bacterium]